MGNHALSHLRPGSVPNDTDKENAPLGLGQEEYEPEIVWGFRTDGAASDLPEYVAKKLDRVPGNRSCWLSERDARNASRFYLNPRDFRALPLDLAKLILALAGVKELVAQDGDLNEIRRWVL